MEKSELIGFVRKVQERVQVLDHETYDQVRHMNTVPHYHMFRMACEEIVPAEWREIVRVLADGESYYGGHY
jgi:hypothetical protein